MAIPTKRGGMMTALVKAFCCENPQHMGMNSHVYKEGVYG